MSAILIDDIPFILIFGATVSSMNDGIVSILLGPLPSLTVKLHVVAHELYVPCTISGPKVIVVEPLLAELVS